MSFIKWQFDPRNPVITPGLNGDLDSFRAGAGHVIQIGDRYRIYYWGTDSDHRHHICVAESPVEHPNAWSPVGSAIHYQPDTQHNSTGPSFPFVVPRDDGPWLLFFCGWGVRKEGGGIPNTTGVALSHDQGRTWQYHPDNPIIELDKPYDCSATGSVWVLYEDGLLRIYYTAIGPYSPRPEGVQTGHADPIPSIGVAYAESRDGIHWTKPFDHRLVEPRGFDTEPYEYIASKPCIVRENDGYRMWVNTFGTAYRVRSLTSRDGIEWKWNPSGPEGEFETGAPGAFDDHQRSYVSVIKHGDEYRCWYTGNTFGQTGTGYAVGRIAQAIHAQLLARDAASPE